jgi:hypothetical protein
VQRIAAACSAILVSAALAQAQTSPPASSGFEKKNYNYSEWTKGLFSEVVTVTHPGKMIFLAGVGAEDESGPRGSIRHLGDFAGQCSYAYDKIKRLLEPQQDRKRACCASSPPILRLVRRVEPRPHRGNGQSNHSGKAQISGLCCSVATRCECPLWVNIGALPINVRFTPKSGH